MIHIAQPVIGEEEIVAVNDVLKSGMLAQGPKVAELEAAFAAYCNTQYAVAVNSGTAALHAALSAVGIGAGDEVITTPFSFIATINSILMCGAKPVLVDIDETSFNLNAELINQATTKRTKAILPVDLYGQPCDYERLWSIAKTHKLSIVEDACQAVGATFQSTRAGGLGDLGCFSLYATKNIMSGEGGMVTTNNETFATYIKQFRQHGMSAPYEYQALGYNYRMTDMQAAIALVQLRKLDTFNEIRQRNAALLSEGLASLPGLILPAMAPHRTHVWHQYTIRLTAEFPLSREALKAKLQAHDIGSAIFYPKPLHAFPHIQAFGYKLGDFPVAEQVAHEVLNLPVHPKVTPSDIDKIVAVFKDIVHG